MNHHDRIDPGADLVPGEWSQPSVSRWMTTPVVSVAPETSVAAATRLMRARGIRHLPVIDARGHLVGILSDRDLRQVVFDPWLDEGLADLATRFETLPVERVMTWRPIAVRPETAMSAAARLMRQYRIGALPVVEDERLVGLLTETDVLRAFGDSRLGHRNFRPIPGNQGGRP